MANKNKTKNISKKEEKRSLFSSLLFNWVKPVLETGKKRPLVFEDLPQIIMHLILKKHFMKIGKKKKVKRSII